MRRQLICASACPFLSSFQACGTNITCSCTILNGASSAISACTACIQSIDTVLAQQFAAAVQDCAILFPTSTAILPTPTTSLTAITSAVVCSSECAPIIQAATCTTDACVCPAYLTAGAACLKCTGTANATASSIISRSISLCFSKLLSVTGTAPGSQTLVPTSVPCATQCGPIIQAQSCTDNACACPAYQIAGAQCLACTGSVDATLSSIISQSISVCLTQSNTQTATAIPTALPCASQCSDVVNVPQTCTTDLCSCSAYVKEGPLCYSCTQPFNATAASILTKDISICLSNFPALGTAAPTPPPCFNPCAFTQQISAVCGTANDTCFCPTFVASASACSACFATVNITYARILSEALDICSSEFPELFTHSTVTSPLSSSARPTSFVTSTFTTLVSGSVAGDSLQGLARVSLVQLGILITVFIGLLTVFL
jgi:hypothetical protein